MELLILASLASGVIGSVVAYLSREGAAEEAEKIVKEAQEKYGDVSPAALEKASKDVLGPTLFGQIQTDPELRQVQREALAGLRNAAREGGLDLTDKAALNEIRTQVERDLSSRQAATLENAAQRGTLSAGQSVAADLIAAQQGAERRNQAGLNIAGMAQRRALDALRQSAGLAAGMEQADYSRQADAARAQDAINRAQWDRNYQLARDMTDLQSQNANRGMGFAQQNAGFAQQRGQNTANFATDLGSAGARAGAGAYNQLYQAQQPAATTSTPQFPPAPQGINPQGWSAPPPPDAPATVWDRDEDGT